MTAPESSINILVEPAQWSEPSIQRDQIGQIGPKQETQALLKPKQKGPP